MKKIKHIENFPKWLKQGIGCCDTYSLYVNLSDMITMCLKQFLKDLKRFPGTPMCYPEIKSYADWRKYLKGIIDDIEKWNKYTKCKKWNPAKENELEEKARKAIERFAKVWRSLWM